MTAVTAHDDLGHWRLTHLFREAILARVLGEARTDHEPPKGRHLLVKSRLQESLGGRHAHLIMRGLGSRYNSRRTCRRQGVVGRSPDLRRAKSYGWAPIERPLFGGQRAIGNSGKEVPNDIR